MRAVDAFFDDYVDAFRRSDVDAVVDAWAARGTPLGASGGQ